MCKRLIGGFFVLAVVTLAWAADMDTACYKTSGDGTNDWEYIGGAWRDDSDGKFKGLMLVTVDTSKEASAKTPTVQRVDEFWFWKEGKSNVVGHYSHFAGVFSLVGTETGAVVLYHRSADGLRKEGKSAGGVTAAMFVGAAMEDGPPKAYTGVHLDVYDQDELDMETYKMRLDKKLTAVARDGMGENPTDPGAGAADAIIQALLGKGYVLAR